MKKVNGDKDPDIVDYIYGQGPADEKPVILRVGALMDFAIIEIEGSKEIEIPGGGYECNGASTGSGKGNQ